MSQSRVSLYVIYYMQLLGWPGLTGIVLLLSSLGLGLSIFIPETEHFRQLTDDMERLQKEIPQRKKTWANLSPQSSLTTFYQFLPAESEVISNIGILLYIVGANDLTPAKVVYTMRPHKEASFSRYQITIPVRGHYIKIRTCINQALNALPALALNEINFIRQDTNTDEVEANLRFTLFLRKGERP